MNRKVAKQKATMTRQMRKHQEQDPEWGEFFAAMHRAADALKDRFFLDWPDMPDPIVGIERDNRRTDGYYVQKDGLSFHHRINLNPLTIGDGLGALEVLAHELVHLWQAYVERPIKGNYHTREFHDRMAEYGIQTEGRRGIHVGLVEDDTTWPDFVKELNRELNLGRFKFGKAEGPRKGFWRHECPGCGIGFRSRRKMNMMCLDCMEVLEWRR